MPFPAPMAKGPNVKFPNLPGNPRTGGIYPKAMEQGRMLEQSIGDAMNELKQVKKDVMDKIQSYIDKALLAVDAQLPDQVRPAILALRIVKFIKKVKEFIQDVQNIIAAIVACISELMAMIANFTAMIQSILNAMTNLLKELCNWSLPDLPAFPNLFGPLLDFNGFNLGHINFKLSKPTFSFNFTLADCKIKLPDLDIFRNQPMGATIDVGGMFKVHVPEPVKLPWNGKIISPLAGKTLKELITEDPLVKALLDNPLIPVLLGPWDPTLLTLGSLPNPAKVVSKYVLPPDTYRDNVVSLIPGMEDLIPTASDREYRELSAWDQEDPSKLTPPARAKYQKFLDALPLKVSLAQVVQSGFDTNIIAAWTFWLERNRKTREGLWLLENQEAYQEHILPTVSALGKDPIPYNTYLGEGETKKGPTHLPLQDLKGKSEPDQKHILWRLSMVEAGLLGIPRNTQWDPWDRGLTGFPDYVKAPMGGTSQTLTLDTPVGPMSLKHDKAWGLTLNTVVERAKMNIQENTLWRTSKVQYRFFYDEYGSVIETDRFTQFWKEFHDRWDALQAEPQEVKEFLMGDWRILDGFLNPLGDTSAYNRFCDDWDSRNRTWKAGDKTLHLPILPAIETPTASLTPEEAGWELGACPLTPEGDLDLDRFLANPDSSALPVFSIDTFLKRPDVRSMPLPHQMAMLDMNLAFVGAMQSATTHLYEANKMLANSTLEANSMGAFTKMLMDNRVELLKGNRDGIVCDIADALPGGSGSVPGGDPGTTTPGGIPTPIPGVMTFKSEGSLKKGTVVKVGANGKVSPINPALEGNDPPYFDGITLTATNKVGEVDVVTVYGTQVTLPGLGWKMGDLLYVAPDATLTPNYSDVITQEQWVILIGRAISTDKFLYEPHIPFNTLFMPN